MTKRTAWLCAKPLGLILFDVPEADWFHPEVLDLQCALLVDLDLGCVDQLALADLFSLTVDL